MTRRELEEALAAVRSRGEIKALAERIRKSPDLRGRLLEIARARRLEFEDDWPEKRLIRALRGRQEQARQRTNPIRRDTAFRCLACERLVTPGGGRVRDHCPHCLRGLHVDDVPGDRAAGCGGLLDPIDFELAGRAGVVIRYRCRRCKHEWQGRAHPDDALPASLQVADLPPVPVRTSTTDTVVDRARTLPRRVLGHLQRHRLWAPGQEVVLAVSGGCDSRVLLELMFRLQDAHKGSLSVISIDHGLRPESVQEVAMVGRLARGMGLPFRGVSLELSPGPNLQARARAARREVCLGAGADRIATGHHLDDQAETVLHHLLRGSGSTGLRGMQVLDPPWCRPLLAEPRGVLQTWAEGEGLSWFDDPSNASSQRGQIREIMPLLDSLHGGAARALARSARLLAREDSLLSELTDRAEAEVSRGGGYDWRALCAQPPALRLRLLRRLVRDCPSPVRANQLEPCLSWKPQGGGCLPLPAGWSLLYRDGILSVQRS